MSLVGLLELGNRCTPVSAWGERERECVCVCVCVRESVCAREREGKGGRRGREEGGRREVSIKFLIHIMYNVYI